VAAIAGPQFSVVSGGVMCLVGLLAVIRYFPHLLRYESAEHAADQALEGSPTLSA